MNPRRIWNLESIEASDWEPNVRMPQRLRTGHAEAHDVHFCQHELTEAALRRAGLSQEVAHLRTLAAHGIRYEPGYERHLYHPDVIREFAEWFNSAAHPPP